MASLKPIFYHLIPFPFSKREGHAQFLEMPLYGKPAIRRKHTAGAISG